MIGKQVFRTCIVMFLMAILLCPSFGTLDPSIKIIGNAKADYVDASNNTNCIEEDPLVPGWSKDVRLTNASGRATNPDVATDTNGSLYVVWDDSRRDYWNIYYKRYIGGCWSEDIPITSLESHGPSVVVGPNNTIFVFYAMCDVEGTTQSNIYCSKSTDFGNTWDTTKVTSLGYAGAPQAIIHKNIIYLVWQDKRDGNMEIYFRKSDDKGSTWDKESRVTNTSNDSKYPAMIVDSIGIIHVIWQENTADGSYVGYTKTENNGESWDNYIPLSSISKSYREPKIAVDTHEGIHVVWTDYSPRGTRGDIFYRKSVDGGKHWDTIVNITQHSTGVPSSFMPDIISDNYSNLYVVWDCSNGTEDESGIHYTSNDLYYTKSRDNGNTWESINRITYAITGARMHPRMVIDKNYILHVVWYGEMSGNIQDLEIYYKRTLNPVTELPITVTGSLNQTACEPGNPITVSGNAVYNGSAVPNANVSIKILGTGAEWNTTTDLNGDYSKIIDAPNTTGNYIIMVTITWDNITSGNHTGWKLVKLTVEQESINGGTTNGGGTNGGQQPGSEENEYGINLNYVVGIVGVIVVCIIIGVVLVKRRGKTAAKTEKEKIEKNTMNLRCPKCKKTFRVELKPKPFGVKCPNCGKEGVIK